MNSPAYDDQNVFAKVLRGELPCEKVYEDNNCIAIMDVMPQGPGHTLVIPKAPSRNMLDIGAADLQRIILVVQRMARAVVKAFDSDGVLVMQFNEPASGQTVFHTHIHVIPRFEGVPLKPHTDGIADAEMLAGNAGKIRAVLEAMT